MTIACWSWSRLSAEWGNPNCEALGDGEASRSGSEPDSASLHEKWEWSTFRIGRNLLSTVKEQVEATVGLPGVKEDGAFRESVQEPGRPVRVDRKCHRHSGNHNWMDDPARESEKLIVARKSRSSRDGAKELYCECATEGRRGEPLV
jgi:hypothetical protein